MTQEFQLKEDEWLLTKADSFVELRLNRGVPISNTTSGPRQSNRRAMPGEGIRRAPWLSRGTYLCLSQQTQIHTIKTNTDDSIFELRHGSIIVVTDRYIRMRPLKIVTPDGTFVIGHGCTARFDVNSPQTIVSVRQGEVKLETRNGSAAKSLMDIGHGKRLRLASGAPPRLESFNADLKTNSVDAFDRWSFRLATAGYLTRYEGKVFIERKSGTKLELVEKGPRRQVQLWEGDRLMTARGSHAEILLSSRAVMHVNEESEIRAISTETFAPHFELRRGAVYLHMWGYGAANQFLWTSDAVFKKVKLEMSTPHGLASISNNGSYRFDADPSSTTIKVREGSLFLGTHEEVTAKTAYKVREKEIARLDGNNAHTPEIIKLTSSPPDDFDKFSTQLLDSLSISGPFFGPRIWDNPANSRGPMWPAPSVNRF